MVFLLYIVLVAANLFWLSLVLQALTALKRNEYLPENLEPVSTPKVSILVSARNESRILSQALDSLLNQDYPDFEILVIDDHSEDNTYSVAASYSERDPRVRVFQSSDLPADWRGKPWALQQATNKADGNWFVLTDADVIHHPGILRCALALAQKEELDFLSVVPYLECHTFWERVILPSWAAILMMIRPLHKSNDPNSSIAFASGGFILAKAHVFKHLRGYESIRTAIAEDLQLATLFKSCGYRIKTVLTRSKWSRTRMYRSLHGIWEGLSRHAFEVSYYSPIRIVAAVTAGYLLVIAPFVTGILAILYLQWNLVYLSLFPLLTMTGMQTVLNH